MPRVLHVRSDYAPGVQIHACIEKRQQLEATPGTAVPAIPQGMPIM